MPSNIQQIAAIVFGASSVGMVVLSYLLVRECRKLRPIDKLQVLGIIPVQGRSLPMIKAIWKKAMTASRFNRVVVAADNEKIANGCRSFGIDVITISESCKNGIDRCLEVFQKSKKYDIVINIQGDESVIERKIINKIVYIQQETLAGHRQFEDEPHQDSAKYAVDLKMLGKGYEYKVVKVGPQPHSKLGRNTQNTL